MTKTAFIYHEHCELHDMGEDHPESPRRTEIIRERLIESGLMEQLLPLKAFQATKSQILRVHHSTYVDQLDRINPKYGLIQADPDTLMGPYTYEASYLAAGAGIQAVDGIMNGAFNRAFCAVRPPGHHAEPNVTMGFCFFNNIAVAAEHALKHHKLSRVAIIDFDVHQCNGTIEMYENRPEVMICTSFQHPFYPNKHWALEHPHILLTPMVAFSDFRDVKEAWQNEWLPALIEHQPEMLFISAGFDAHTNDPMGQINWQTDDYYWLTEELKHFADSHCQGRIVSMLEGGYDLKSLADSAELHIRSLSNP
ncbi:histone deacetylase family protein [Reinekea blandensis]|uniref:Deacetylase, including yeast histone deacetylase and acetoin utilization protein n=1 Tax=Reinekea blandensis MED297 TaxID=314283 RepID=A4BCK9_9GAMM|nr:histone deacetylase family protein [Reinekea blandensis]EAR10275.1 Deacetylase, including yeast histone deacetylase and acetoin utilization protein [Reinekea sp. MED297] [Reinekea blandensis MED297]